MSDCSTINLTLPQWDGGSRKIRFIYLVNPTSFRLTDCPDKTPAIPLYLGADIFSNTDIRTENHPRHHAKFAKKGLATKVNFSSAYRFHGLKVPIARNSLWFYSVQGVFRVAFEMYSNQEQLAVLENLQGVWKSQINDQHLEMSYNLTDQLDHAPLSCFQEAGFGNKATPLECQCDEKSVDPPGVDTVDHNYCSFPKQALQTEQKGDELAVTEIKQKFQHLMDKLSFNHQSCQNTDIIQILLENIDQCIHGNLEEKDVIETVLALLKAKDWGCVYSSALLSYLGQWLGQQFHAANSKISQKVESFKVHHIERISNLPPAEDLASELFPDAMKTLLLHWMGLSGESTMEKRHMEYPILLLILEFANHNLITGVAHVLYSSLICK